MAFLNNLFQDKTSKTIQKYVFTMKRNLTLGRLAIKYGPINIMLSIQIMFCFSFMSSLTDSFIRKFKNYLLTGIITTYFNCQKICIMRLLYGINIITQIQYCRCNSLLNKSLCYFQILMTEFVIMMKYGYISTRQQKLPHVKELNYGRRQTCLR